MTRFSALVAIVALGSASAARAALVTFDDGGTHIIDASHTFPADGGSIADHPVAGPTTVIIKPGGEFGDSIQVFGSSLLVLDGGTAGTYIQAGDTAHIEVRSGTVEYAVGTAGSATARIEGGVIGQGIQAIQSSVLDLLGGAISGEIVAGAGGVINIHGTGFNFPLGALEPISGTLTGTLRDGTALSIAFDRDMRGIGTINLVPEPAGFAIVAASVAGLAIRRRR